MEYEQAISDEIRRLEATGKQTKYLVALMEAYPPPNQDEWDACIEAVARKSSVPVKSLACIREYEERIFRGRIPSALGQFVAEAMKEAEEVAPIEFAVDMCKLYLLVRGERELLGERGTSHA